MRPVHYILEPGNGTRYELIYSEYKHDPSSPTGEPYGCTMCSITWLTQTRGGIMYTWPKGNSLDTIGYVKEKFAPRGHSISTQCVGYILCDVFYRFQGSIGSIPEHFGYSKYIPSAPKHKESLRKFKVESDGPSYTLVQDMISKASTAEQLKFLFKQIEEFARQGSNSTPPELEKHMRATYDSLASMHSIMLFMECKDQGIRTPWSPKGGE
tara:strand:- start:155 stop:787 length:633 start_codon:yes stop_codon:yes gene_type:complete